MHWNHDNIIKYENRPLDFNELIIKNWRELVLPNDIVYHLGDVIFKREGELKYILGQLPGRKILIQGNHDRNKSFWYIEKGFESVHKYYTTSNGILLSHKPLDIKEIEKSGGHKISFNIHGHFHNKQREELSRSKAGYPFYSEKHKLLSIEIEDYKPVLLDEFLSR